MSRLVVCEKTSRWAVALRRATAQRVYETRSLSECWQDLSAHPASCIAIEITPDNVHDVVRHLWLSGRAFPDACFIALADRSLAEYEWLIRESGAVHFHDSRGYVAPLVALIERHLARASAASEESWEAIIWNRLPWG